LRSVYLKTSNAHFITLITNCSLIVSIVPVQNRGIKFAVHEEDQSD